MTTSTLDRVLALHRAFKEGKIPTLAQHEVNPGLPKGSRENYLYFTLPPCLNFQRHSPAMWASALKTWEDPETNYLFFPEETAKRSIEEIRAGLLKHKLALQPNKHIEIWMRVSNAFHEHFKDDPRELLAAGGNDVLGVHRIIQEEKRKDFPYISGPKMANYWLYILSHYTDAKLANMGEISIIPDTHVLQASVRLGLADEGAAPVEVARVWKELLAGSPLTPVEMHPVLWNWSRNHFLPEA